MTARAPTFEEAGDAELADKARTGDAGALTSLVRRYQATLLRFARSLTRGDAVAQEVVQDTWLAVIGGVEKFEGRSSFKTWLFRILHNRAASKGVKENRAVPFSALGDGTEEEDSVPGDQFRAGFWKKPPRRWDDPSAENSLQQIQLRRLIEEELEKLPDLQKKVVLLRDVEGMESAEVCELLGITEANQRVLLHRGRSRIRLALEKHVTGEKESK